MSKPDTSFTPEWVSAPGETILEILEERGWSQSEFAERAGYTSKHASLLINGRASITQETAFRLEKVVGGTAGFWLSRQANYQEALARENERSVLESQSGWLDELPVAHMVKYGWVNKKPSKAAQVSEILSFFGVASVEIWRQRYAEAPIMAAVKPSESHQPRVTAWLRQGEREAEQLKCGAFDKAEFIAALGELRGLTNEGDPHVFVPELTQVCAKVGVAVVLEPAPKGCPVTGATKWLTKEKALLMLSLGYKTNDRLWFAFFHQAGHLILHGKRMMFLELDGGMTGGDEEQADAFARDLLIPPDQAEMLPYVAHRYDEVKAFSEKIDVAPGIVVRRMQHDGFLPMNYLNKLKVWYRWTTE